MLWGLFYCISICSILDQAQSSSDACLHIVAINFLYCSSSLLHVVGLILLHLQLQHIIGGIEHQCCLSALYSHKLALTVHYCFLLWDLLYYLCSTLDLALSTSAAWIEQYNSCLLCAMGLILQILYHIRTDRQQCCYILELTFSCCYNFVLLFLKEKKLKHTHYLVCVYMQSHWSSSLHVWDFLVPDFSEQDSITGHTAPSLLFPLVFYLVWQFFFK